jgi:hypothetical protein
MMVTSVLFTVEPPGLKIGFKSLTEDIDTTSLGGICPGYHAERTKAGFKLPEPEDEKAADQTH